ncbi:MAG: hypothetical protein ACK5PS_15955 [Desulfopila sp.]
MTATNQDQTRFLYELYTLTEGSLEAEISMYQVGQTVGLDKESTSSMSQDLMIEELIELKTLSGGIGINEKTLQFLEDAGLIAAKAGGLTARLGQGPVISEEDRLHIESLCLEIKKALTTTSAEYSQVEELVIDIKTVEIQLLSPRPKTSVIQALFCSLYQSLEKMGAATVGERIKAFTAQ